MNEQNPQYKQQNQFIKIKRYKKIKISYIIIITSLVLNILLIIIISEKIDENLNLRNRLYLFEAPLIYKEQIEKNKKEFNKSKEKLFNYLNIIK